MRHNEQKHARLYNELIFDPAPWVSGLPGSIEAFFLPPWSSPADVASTFRAHAAFRRIYGIKVGVPMLNYDPSSLQHPFKLRNNSLSTWCRPGSSAITRRGEKTPPCGRLHGIQQRLAQLASQLTNSTARLVSSLG